MKEEVRPLYNELQGYLSQAPSETSRETELFEESIWGQFHTTISELNTLTGKNYDKFRVKPLEGGRSQFVRVSEYRTKLGGLISRLYGEYFGDEPAPFSGMPSTIVTQYQHQSQNVQILLEIQGSIDKILPMVESQTERSFLQKIKGSLSSVRNIRELLNLILTTGSSMGLTLEQISKLFK